MHEFGGDPGASPLSGGLLPLLDRGDALLDKVAQRVPFAAQIMAHLALSTRGLLLALLGLLLLLLLPPAVAWLLRRADCARPNFRGETIVTSFGLAILLWAGAMLALRGWLYPETRAECFLWLAAILGFGLLGLFDDWRGDRTVKGLRGHLRAAIKDRKITTGFLKATLGSGLALWLGWQLYPADLLRSLLAALLIALSANAINLLDLRPGRAGAVFLAAGAGLLWQEYRQTYGTLSPLLFVWIPALVVWQRDARGQAMLGDAGSNLLGAALGLALARLPYPPALIALALLAGLHLLAERASLTALIEQTPLLRALDRLTGVR